MYIVKISDEIVSKADYLHFWKWNAKIQDYMSTDSRKLGDVISVETDEQGEPIENPYYANYDGTVFREEYPMAVIEEVVDEQ